MGDVLGRLWIVFFLGRERGRGNSMSRTTESFSQDDTSLRTSLFYVIYYILNSGSFSTSSFRSS
jgi:hypothetical protein